VKVAGVCVGLAFSLLIFSGCNRQPDLEYEPSAEVKKLNPDLQAEVASVLREKCGTPANPILLGNETIEAAHLRRGAAVYAKNCARCHGTTGDGNGPAAQHLIPRPRDYRRGMFKFTTTGYGAKPRRDDLVRTVVRGVAGTSMPSFRLLPKKDLEAVIDYVLVLTHRGELEFLLASEADINDEVEREMVQELIDEILARWHEANFDIIQPLTPQPEFTSEHVAAGKEAFLTKGCSKCHGEDGRGQTRENIGMDGWGFPTKAADLTSGMLRGGPLPIDVYRRIYGGINGTPMPGFSSALSQEPETIWNLASYVLYVSERRRNGEVPAAGLVRPLPGVEASEGAAGAPSNAGAAGTSGGD